MPHQCNFRFFQTAIQTVRGRYIKINSHKYKIIPSLIAVDVNKKDIEELIAGGLGEAVTGRISNGTPAYQSLKP